jgi:hypothetical protein
MRKRLWIVLAIVLVLVATFAAWPRRDPYDYLRSLNPKVMYYRTEASPGYPSEPGIEFEFNDSYQKIKALLLAHGAKPNWDNERAGVFRTADGKLMALVSVPTRTPPTSLTIFDQEPTWFEAKLQALKAFLHVR